MLTHYVLDTLLDTVNIRTSPVPVRSTPGSSVLGRASGGHNMDAR